MNTMLNYIKNNYLRILFLLIAILSSPVVFMFQKMSPFILFHPLAWKPLFSSNTISLVQIMMSHELLTISLWLVLPFYFILWIPNKFIKITAKIIASVYLLFVGYVSLFSDSHVNFWGLAFYIIIFFLLERIINAKIAAVKLGLIILIIFVGFHIYALYNDNFRLQWQWLDFKVESKMYSNSRDVVESCIKLFTGPRNAARSHCITDIARMENDISLCEEILDDPSGKAACLRESGGPSFATIPAGIRNIQDCYSLLERLSTRGFGCLTIFYPELNQCTVSITSDVITCVTQVATNRKNKHVCDMLLFLGDQAVGLCLSRF